MCVETGLYNAINSGWHLRDTGVSGIQLLAIKLAAHTGPSVLKKRMYWEHSISKASLLCNRTKELYYPTKKLARLYSNLLERRQPWQRVVLLLSRINDICSVTCPYRKGLQTHLAWHKWAQQPKPLSNSADHKTAQSPSSSSLLLQWWARSGQSPQLWSW